MLSKRSGVVLSPDEAEGLAQSCDHPTAATIRIIRHREFHAHLSAAPEARNISDYQLASLVTEEETTQHISRVGCGGK